MNKKAFIKYIESIGFVNIRYNRYGYKEYRIDLDYDCYDFYNGSEWIIDISFNDLILLEKEFKQELRRIKLKELLR